MIVNRSDMLGGAAIASHRLMRALRRQGVDARMLVIDRRDIDPYAQAMGNELKNKWNFLAERLGIYLHNGFKRDTLFKIDTATRGYDLCKHPWVSETDIVVLNWINQGTLSLNTMWDLADMGKHVVWTMHDMWNCTGVCHHAYDCRKYEHTCKACPLLGTKGNDLSTRTQKRKKELYASVPISFVAVSNWLADCCRRSSLMAGSNVQVIANPFPTDDYGFDRYRDEELDIPVDKTVVAMGAARLDDPVKGFDRFIAMTRYIADNKPALASKLHFLLYGGIKDESLLDEIALPFTYLGFVDSYEVNNVYRQADIVLSTSLHESFGYTLVEGMASGCVPVTTGDGGQVDIVEHLKNGYVASSVEPAELAKGLEWAEECHIERGELHAYVAENFDSSIIADKYVTLFDNLLAE